MRTLFENRKRFVLVLLTIVAAVFLICGYNAIAKGRFADTKQNTHTPPLSSSGQSSTSASLVDEEEENDPDFVQKRLEFMNRFRKPAAGGVSADVYVKALAHMSQASSIPTSSSALLSPLATTGALTWTFPVPPPIGNDWGGGASARTDAIAVDPTNAEIVYVGSEGGLAKSTDGGTTWAYLSDGFESQSIRCIVVDPVNPAIIYVGTGTQEYFGVGVYRSTNSGNSWSLISGPSATSPFAGRTIVKIAIDPGTAGSSTTTILYASVLKFADGGTHSVWKSTDSGSTWNQKRGPVSGAPYWPGYGFYDIAIDGNNPSTIYVTAPGGGAAAGGVFRSTDKGETWSANLKQIGDHAAPSALAYSQSTLYLAFKEGNPNRTSIFKSIDQGATWGPNPPLNPDGELYCFGVDPVHPERMFIGGGGDLRYSLQLGAANTWISSGGVHVDIHSIAFCPSAPQRNYLGTDGGIYRADYDGLNNPPSMTWVSKNANLAGALIQGISLSSDGHMVMGNQDNGNQSCAGGNSPWMMVRGGDGFKPQIDQTNSNKFYFVGLSYGHRVDGTWTPLTRVVNGVWTDITPPGALAQQENSSIFPAMFMAPANSARVLLGFQNVWRSTNSGGSWAQVGGTFCANPPNNTCGIDPGITIDALYEAPSDTAVIYAITGSGGRLFVTNDNGLNWINRTAGLPGGLGAVTVHPTNPQTAYVACGSDVYKTTNGGSNWTNLTAPSYSNLIYHDIAIDPGYPHRVFVASHAGVLVSVNDGLTWENVSADIPKGMAVTSLSFNASSRKLAAATYGRGAYVAAVPITAVSINTPPNGAYVTGNVPVSADTSNDVVAVQFKANGSNIGGEDDQPPFSVPWDTTLLPPGDYTLTATARNAASSLTNSTGVIVHVNVTTPSPTPTPTVAPTPPPTPTFPPGLKVSAPIFTMTISDGFVVNDQPVTTTFINPTSSYIGFQADLTFDSAIAAPSPATMPVAPSGLTASGWTVAGAVLNSGPGTMKTLRISAFSNDGVTPLSGAGTLFIIHWKRVSTTFGASTSLSWRPFPNDFEFINDNFDSIPVPQNNGLITIVGDTPTPPPVSISGSILYCSNPTPVPVPNVLLSLTGSGSGTTLSDGSGNYTFGSLPSGGGYTVTPTKPARTPGTGGINTVDVLAAQRHFLSITVIPPGCRLTAADVNGDLNVTTIDVLAVQRFFLGLTTGTANAGKYQFNPTSRNYPGVSGNQTNQNYDTLVFGDVASPFVE